MVEEGEGLGLERIERWTIHKWCLLMSVGTVFVYGMAALVFSVLTWLQTWPQADVVNVADLDVLILITLASSALLLTFLLGLTGTILNSRPILAVYALLLWPAGLSVIIIGYVAYKRATFALDRKLSYAWSDWYTPLDRLVIQNSLRCCGFYDALHDATPSKQCYSRTPLPGCKGRLYRFEKQNLDLIWSAAFALVPLHIANIVVSLLCANHVTHTFGKGLMPKKYRLSGADVRADAEKILGPYAPVRPVRRPEMSRASSSDYHGLEKTDPNPNGITWTSSQRPTLWASQVTGLGLDPWVRKQV
ncbi:hypothetical protein CERSUDRAFT_150212 [Gelatoporia subvermispora B]|uniref:Tetraspanin Tsp2 n=1 Tax=Ceriporiopsis subvermispora (strain B) TaxID=914234 RepID=M2RMB1_CERS8|nr:hypothetical protein CERSUDRAFT_150212 [Gelatoporia subvermispora B]